MGGPEQRFEASPLIFSCSLLSPACTASARVHSSVDSGRRLQNFEGYFSTFHT